MPNVESFQLPEEFLIAGAAVKAGIFEALKNKSLTQQELAAATGSDQRALWIVAEALVSLGYIEYETGKLKLTETCFSILYDKSSPDYQGVSFMHSWYLFSKWLELPEILKTGKPATKSESFEEKRSFIEAMSSYAEEDAAEIAGYCLKGLPSGTRVLDIGGGPLTIARAFALKGAEVTILDLPEVIEMMEPELDPGLSIKMVQGDFTSGLPDGPFTLAYLGHICHIYGEKEIKKLFLDVAGKLKEDGRLVINDFIRGAGPYPAVFAVNMLVNTDSGGTWTFEQYKAWLEDAGFKVDPYEEVGDNQLIKAHKQG
jgi:SAM-dependent methyltransferase